MNPNALLFAVGCVFLGLVLRMTLRLAYGSRGPVGDDPLFFILDLIGGLLIVSAGVTIAVMVAGPLSILLVIVIIATAIMTFVRRRATQRQMVGSVLAVAAEKGLPLDVTLQAVASSAQGGVGGNARLLARALKRGEPLSQAATMHAGALPEMAPMLLQVSGNGKTAAPALREAVSEATFAQLLWQATAGRLLYLLAIVTIGQGVVFFVMLKIVPAQQKIFEDFELELPEVTLWFIAASRVLVDYWFLYLPLLLLGGIVLIVAGMGYMGLLRHVPFSDILLRRRHAAVVLRTLAVVAEAGRPLEPALSMLAATYPYPRVRRRLERAADSARAGDDWCASLRAAGLIRRSDAAILQVAEPAGNLPWALRDVADAGLRRLAFRVQAAVQILFPIAVVVIGALVGWFAVAILFPLSEMISGLTV